MPISQWMTSFQSPTYTLLPRAMIVALNSMRTDTETPPRWIVGWDEGRVALWRQSFKEVRKAGAGRRRSSSVAEASADSVECLELRCLS